MPVSAQPPAECDGCEQYAVMHAEIALALDIHDETDAHGLQELILKKLRAAQPPGVVQLEGACPSCQQWVVLRSDKDECFQIPGPTKSGEQP